MSGLSLIEYGSPKFPSPSKILGKLSWIIEVQSVVASTLAAKLRVIIAGRPNKLVLRPLTTKISCLDDFPLWYKVVSN